MPEPKRKTSRAKRDSRRAQWKIDIAQTVACPQCKKAKLPHHACSFCGYYKNWKVMKSEEERAKKKEERGR